MFIRDIFAQKKPVLSFEVFPPKKDSGLDNVISAVDELSKMPIDYLSVTYGLCRGGRNGYLAGGQSARQRDGESGAL